MQLTKVHRAVLAVVSAYRPGQLWSKDIERRVAAWDLLPPSELDWSAVRAAFHDLMADHVEKCPDDLSVWATAEGKAEAADLPEPLRFRYVNYKGEESERSAVPIRIYHGSTEHRPRPQWLMHALDVDKGADITFAMSDMVFLKPEASSV